MVLGYSLEDLRSGASTMCTVDSYGYGERRSDCRGVYCSKVMVGGKSRSNIGY